MSALPRRRLLAGAAALLSGLAGCSESTTDTGSAPGEHRPENVARNPEAAVLRSSDEAGPLAWLPPDDASGSGDAAASDSSDAAAASDPPAGSTRWVIVASRSRADRLRFADVDGAADARRFVAETDFDEETLYLDPQTVSECFALELCYVTWSATEIDTRYGRHYRDADVSCRTDATDRTAWLIRIPDALDPDEVSSHGSGMSSGGCTYPPYLRATPGSYSPTETGRATTAAETTPTSADAKSATAGTTTANPETEAER
ncbi:MULTISPECIES: hypothetical protein [Halorussus]|uniref:hypothetical protein n=1 Tax=Halorussus TaxID=1070314 RepID=UPI000E217343|nr:MULTISPECIES: hypothetical protein [Halorussus]NHN61256.1 hypothetical protein [Halorussus sp. JP-T4]